MRELEPWMTKQILRLRAHGLSRRETARSLQISHSTVGDYLDRADKAGLSWPLLEGMTEAELDRALFPPDRCGGGSGGGGDGGDGNGGLSTDGRAEPDWSEVIRELRRKGVTRQHLWLEYRERHPDGFGYSRFYDRLRVWRGQTETTMPQ